MNPSEAARLLAHAAAFDNRTVGEAAAIAWAAALSDVPFDADTKAAVAAYYTTAPKDLNAKLWLLPHHVRTLRAKLRDARLENFQYEPPAGEVDPHYRDRLRTQLSAVADGRVPAPAARPALEGGPHESVVKELAARGWQVGQEVPDDDGEEDLHAQVRRSGPLGVTCPTCSAPIGRPCHSGRGSASKPLGKTLKPHSARRRAAAGEPVLTPEQQAAQEERVRAASRRALAALEEAS